MTAVARQYSFTHSRSYNVLSIRDPCHSISAPWRTAASPPPMLLVLGLTISVYSISFSAARKFAAKSVEQDTSSLFPHGHCFGLLTRRLCARTATDKP